MLALARISDDPGDTARVRRCEHWQHTPSFISLVSVALVGSLGIGPMDPSAVLATLSSEVRHQPRSEGCVIAFTAIARPLSSRSAFSATADISPVALGFKHLSLCSVAAGPLLPGVQCHHQRSRHSIPLGHFCRLSVIASHFYTAATSVAAAAVATHTRRHVLLSLQSRLPTSNTAAFTVAAVAATTHSCGHVLPPSQSRYVHFNRGPQVVALSVTSCLFQAS